MISMPGYYEFYCVKCRTRIFLPKGSSHVCHGSGQVKFRQTHVQKVPTSEPQPFIFEGELEPQGEPDGPVQCNNQAGTGSGEGVQPQGEGSTGSESVGKETGS